MQGLPHAPCRLQRFALSKNSTSCAFASTRSVQIATRPRLCVWHDLFRFASTRSVQIATRKAVSMLCFLRFASTRSVQIATGLCADCHQKRALCLHTLRADCNLKEYDKSRAEQLCLHTLRADCNRGESQFPGGIVIFASTRSVQIATVSQYIIGDTAYSLPPHAPCRLQLQKCTEL